MTGTITIESNSIEASLPNPAPCEANTRVILMLLLASRQIAFETVEKLDTLKI